MSFVKDTYELNDPNTYAIYLKDIRAEPEKEYITSGSGYLKWEQVFYFDGRDWWSSRLGKRYCTNLDIIKRNRILQINQNYEKLDPKFHKAPQGAFLHIQRL